METDFSFTRVSRREIRWRMRVDLRAMSFWCTMWPCHRKLSCRMWAWLDGRVLSARWITSFNHDIKQLALLRLVFLMTQSYVSFSQPNAMVTAGIVCRFFLNEGLGTPWNEKVRLTNLRVTMENQGSKWTLFGVKQTPALPLFTYPEDAN